MPNKNICIQEEGSKPCCLPQPDPVEINGEKMLTNEQFLVKFNVHKLMRQGIPDDDYIRIGSSLGIDPTLVLQIINDYKTSVIESAERIQNIFELKPDSVRSYKKILCIGDSNSSDRESYFNIVRQIFSKNKNIGFIDSSISGATTSDFLNLIYTYAINLDPHIVIVMLGTNDARKNADDLSKNIISADEYYKNMQYIVGLLTARNISVIINTIPPVINQYQKNTYGENNWHYCDEDIVQYNRILNIIADEYSVKLNRLDFESAGISKTDALSYDGIHLSRAGQEFIAKKLYSVIMSLLIK